MSDLPQPNKGCLFLALAIAAIIIGGGFALGQGLATLPAFNDPKIQVCDKGEKLIVVIQEDDFNKKVYSKDLEDCK